MTDQFEYIATEGERFDQIAHKSYGRSTLIKPIIEANPQVPITPKLRAGTVLFIPVLDEAISKTDKEFLPPWKRDL